MSKTRKGLVAVCFVVIAAAVGYIAFYYTSLARQKALAEQLREAASAASLPANSEESAAASTDLPMPPRPVRKPPKLDERPVAFSIE